MRISSADTARTALGLALVLRPRLPFRGLGVTPTGAGDVAARVLGARWLAQAALGAAAGGGKHARTVGRVDAAVEAAHAVSMVLLAATAPRWRRAALASAVLATGFAVADVRVASRPDTEAPDPWRARGPLSAV